MMYCIIFHKISDKNYYSVNYFITILGFSIYKSYHLSEQKTKNVNVYTNCIYEFNKRIDEIKNHSVNKDYIFFPKSFQKRACNKVMKIIFVISTTVTSSIIHNFPLK
jgi:hypothetical protein